MRACYEGTQNTSVIKFREDNSFEIHGTGIFFASFWALGHWKKSGDTIFFKFDKKETRLLSDTVIIHNKYLIPSAEMLWPDSLRIQKEWAHYYLGYCKGEN